MRAKFLPCVCLNNPTFKQCTHTHISLWWNWFRCGAGGSSSSGFWLLPTQSSCFNGLFFLVRAFGLRSLDTDDICNGGFFSVVFATNLHAIPVFEIVFCPFLRRFSNSRRQRKEAGRGYSKRKKERKGPDKMFNRQRGENAKSSQWKRSLLLESALNIFSRDKKRNEKMIFFMPEQSVYVTWSFFSLTNFEHCLCILYTLFVFRKSTATGFRRQLSDIF